MKTVDQVDDDKLRGGFYTPDFIVQLCLDRAASLLSDGSISVLEPSVGDGAFIRGLQRHDLGNRVTSFQGVEVDHVEAAKAQSAAVSGQFAATVTVSSILAWERGHGRFNLAVGNPPFVRYQFIDDADVAGARRLAETLLISFRGVSNLWVPVFLFAASSVEPGGAISFVIPSELLTGISAGTVRSWLIANFEDLTLDLLEPGSCPGVLQQVVVLSARRADACSGARKVTFVDHLGSNLTVQWQHSVPKSESAWTRFLLTPKQLEAVEISRSSGMFLELGRVAKLEVSIVTGANDFFCVPHSVAKDFDLEAWCVPLLPKIRESEGIVFEESDQRRLQQSGEKCWLLNFDERLPDPTQHPGATAYLRRGEAQGLHHRYKTSIRTPWYRIPSVWHGDLLLSKRSHHFGRLVLNEAGSVTTDTIYRGRVRGLAGADSRGLVASFHNSLTLLTAELEGRSFGGGVLELVPTEINRLLVPVGSPLSEDLAFLDTTARAASAGVSGQFALVDATDTLLKARLPGLDSDVWDVVRSAHWDLWERRMKRSSQTTE